MSQQGEYLALPQRIHLVGIAGIGLSAIARVLAMRGHDVRGSDMRGSAVTAELEALGVRTYLGHAAAQVADAELVVVSSAVPENNPELVAARAAGIPVVHRREMLGRLLAGREGIAVAGTHGKTTTTSMTTLILHHAGLAPSFVVGGIICELGLNAAAGTGPQFVIEADEYDRAFLGLRPRIAVVTNIEMDHPDCYRDLDDMRETFGAFLEGVSPEGLIVACADSPQLMRLLAGRAWAAPRVVTYGLSCGADYRLADLRPNAQGGVAATVFRQDRLWAEVSLPYPGAHTALNATAAMLVAEQVGVPPERAARTLAHYGGVLRRFEVKGEAAGITVVDDYAHHPTEVRATLAAARARYGARRLWVVMQPHTYSRVQALFDEFCASLAEADQVIVTGVYAARSGERPLRGYDAVDLVAAIKRCFPEEQVRYAPTLDEATALLEKELAAGDVLLTLGAGDGYLIGERVLARLMGGV
jgi:UDP-N-acetylmuramate--alanine ligase